MTDNANTRRLVAIGSPVLDRIKRFNGKEIFSWGGITYSLYTFIQLALKDTDLRFQLIPLFKVGNDSFSKSLISELEKFEFLDLRYISTDGSLHYNRLVYYNERDRYEYFSWGDATLEIKDLLPLFNEDAYFINYIYADDLPLDVLKSLSSATTGLIYLDVHSLVRKATPKSGKFQLIKFGQWQSIVPLVDLLQMNVLELQAFTGLEIKTDEDIFSIIQQFLLLGPKVVLITNGGEPGYIGYRVGGKHQIQKFYPESVKPVDPTGCGDVFGATFFYFYIKTGDSNYSLGKALHIAKQHSLRRWIPQKTFQINIEQEGTSE